MARLIEAGHVIRDGMDFRATEEVLAAYNAISNRASQVRDQERELERFLGAEPCGPKYRPLVDSSGRAISRQEFDAAVQSYVRKV